MDMLDHEVSLQERTHRLTEIFAIGTGERGNNRYIYVFKNCNSVGV